LENDRWVKNGEKGKGPTFLTKQQNILMGKKRGGNWGVPMVDGGGRALRGPFRAAPGGGFGKKKRRGGNPWVMTVSRRGKTKT